MQFFRNAEVSGAERKACDEFADQFDVLILSGYRCGRCSVGSVPNF